MRVTKNCNGDCGIFLKRDIFERIQGHDPVPYFEDVLLCQKAKRIGRLELLNLRIQSSTRQFVQEGSVRLSISYLLAIFSTESEFDRDGSLNTLPCGETRKHSYVIIAFTWIMVLLLQGIAVLVAVSVALFFLAWVRRIEMYHREPWSSVLLAFGVGAIVTIVGGASLSALLLVPLQGFGDCLPFSLTATGFLSTVVIAPISEELIKALGVLAMRPRFLEVEDGIVYGAAVGLGFAATENILYFSAAITTAGAIGLAGTAIVRSLTSTLLHLGATGLSGYGFSRYYVLRDNHKRIRWFGYLLAAILFHAVLNLFASLQLITTTFIGQIVAGMVGLFLGVVLVWSLFGWLRRRISELDRSTAPLPMNGT